MYNRYSKYNKYNKYNRYNIVVQYSFFFFFSNIQRDLITLGLSPNERV